MARIKIMVALFCILLVNHDVIAVVNKASSESSPTKEDDKNDSLAAEDRVSNSYGPPADDYGPPPSPKYNGPAPVYGPPELTGDYRPPQIYAPPPPEQPPPIISAPKPFQNYGAPNRPKPQYGPPKQTYGPPQSAPKPIYGPPKSQYGPPKLQYGPPKIQFGPPKSQYGPPKSSYRPSLTSFKPPKSEYGPPIKFSSPASSQYGPPSGGFGNGPSIPSSVEAYGPPAKTSVSSFISKPEDNYGPPPPVQAPQQQYGPPNDLYGPPPAAPPPGVPAPPTPPVIKYDGWQPIAGHVNAPNQQQPPSNEYGPPLPSNDYGPPPPSNEYNQPPPSNDYVVPPQSNQYAPPAPSNDYGTPQAPSNDYGTPQAPSNDYGTPQAPSNDYGAPQPPSNDYGAPQPPSNDYGAPQAPSNDYGAPPSFNDFNPPPRVNVGPPSNQYGSPINNGPGSGNEHFGSIVRDPITNIPSDSYGMPLNNPEDHSLKSSVSHITISHESDGLPPPALPQFEPLHNNQRPIDSSSSNHIEQHQPSGQYGLPNADIVKTVGFELLPNIGANSGRHPSGSRPSGGLPDLSTQQLPTPISGNYGPPSDTYGSPSFTSGGSFSSSHGHRGNTFPSFNQFNSGFHKSGGHYRNKHNLGLRAPLPPPSGFVPPRRPPMKFRDTVPAALVSNINRYLPPVKPHKTYGPPSVQKQQLPNLQNSVSFHGSSNSFNTGNSFSQSNSVSAAVVAPNVHYGTPLSFDDFNTPAPTLTYGAPNFVPPLSLGNGNLYQGVETSIAPTYGTPTVNAPGSDCQNNGGKFHHGFDNINSQSSNYEVSSHQSFSNAHGGSSSAGINLEYRTPAINSVSNSLGSSYVAPNVNELELENNREHHGNLKDSYGNPIDNNFGASDQSSTAITNQVQSVSNEFSDSSRNSQNSLSRDASFQNSGLSAEALTAALTAQGFGEVKNIVPSNEVDATQFIKSEEGGRALALAQTLTADGDSFQIQGSQGKYSLLIQPADGGYGTENSDGSIKHEQVLSNGLLQNILAAIEQQPEGGQIELQRIPNSQQVQQGYSQDLSQAASSSIISNVKISSSQELSKELSENTSSNNLQNNDQDSSASEHSNVALFFNQGYSNTNSESRSALENEHAEITDKKENTEA